ncbi:LMWPc-domain-containing protein [Xylariaceae sp. FL0255]|nr:LMWPc-domain-containing protein [Xylariaceae sp. FL0255]
MGSTAPPEKKPSVLFVCLGNICRSTMAEGVFRSIVEDPTSSYNDLIGNIDSCGTGAYHAGYDPDSRTLSTLRSNGITSYTHTARQLRDSDFKNFDYIFAMDRSNLSDINQRQNQKKSSGGVNNKTARVMLFGEFSGTDRSEVVQDPWYDDGDEGFKKAYEQCRRFSKNFLAATFPDVPSTTT